MTRRRVVRFFPALGWVLFVVAVLHGSPAGAASESASARPPYEPDRRDYVTFREAHANLLEPNYLPFMVHRLLGQRLTGDNLVFCRWADGEMPLAVFIEHPEIPDSLQDEFYRVESTGYVDAVQEALQLWQDEMEGLVRFRRVADPAEANLRIRLRAEKAPLPVPEKEVLGTTALLDACQASRWDPDSERLDVRFAVPEIELFLADRHGLLMADQVGRVAAHELGHALGMNGHSPNPADLMYPIVRDRTIVEGLSVDDVNSFVSLYRLPNGSHYAQVPPGDPTPPPPPRPPTGGVRLEVAPHVDPRLGFDLKTPEGWLRTETPHGVFTANGPGWDHDVALEIVIWPSPTVEDFHRRFVEGLLEGSWLRRRGPVQVAGRRAIRTEIEDAPGQHAESFSVLEIPGDRVMLIHTTSPAEGSDAWRPWFDATLASLHLWDPDKP
ncbi:MAG: matrixin family metalloprotease [Myxococcota bacterium]